MSGPSERYQCDQTELVAVYAVGALLPTQVPIIEAHLGMCPDCRNELEMLRPIVDSVVFWPNDVLRPPGALWGRLARRIAAETGEEPLLSPTGRWSEPEWDEVAPGLSCKLLSTDSENARVSMLVRLAPGAVYPPHEHAGLEELHLLHGELWIDDRKLHAGDYNRAEPGSVDQRVWSETGCTCVLITSTRDELR
jgi:anti-sigma factor ChrR (cupin superfamily)